MTISRATVKSIVFHRNTSMSVRLTDGRVISVPLKWYPRLANAKASERRTWEISGAGAAIHWPIIDEDLSIHGLLNGYPSPEYKPSRQPRGHASLSESHV
jgi:hypothetical protein